MTPAATGNGAALLHAVPAGLGQPLKGLRVGLPKEYFGDGLAASSRAVLEAAIAELTKLGANTVEISLPNTALAVPTYYVVAPAEASSNLARFDGVRYGYRCENPRDLTDLYNRSRGEGLLVALIGDQVSLTGS